MLLLGVGHKARQGKDSLGEYLGEKHGFHVLHFADALKEEATQAGWDPANKNEPARDVLSRILYKTHLNGDARSLNSVEREITIFINTRKIDIKTIPESLSFLQWLGTEFRRTQDKDYWVKSTWRRILALWQQRRREAFIEELCKDIIGQLAVASYPDEVLMLKDKDYRVAICDMRFVNELLAVKQWGGWSIEVKRLISRPTTDNPHTASLVWDYYVDPERDPFHPSEIELDAIPHDFNIEARNLDELFYKGDNIIKFLTNGGGKWLK